MKMLFVDVGGASILLSCLVVSVLSIRLFYANVFDFQLASSTNGGGLPAVGDKKRCTSAGGSDSDAIPIGAVLRAVECYQYILSFAFR